MPKFFASPPLFPSPPYDSAVVRSAGDEISLAFVCEKCHYFRGSLLAQLEEHVALDLKVGSWSSTLGTEILLFCLHL